MFPLREHHKPLRYFTNGGEAPHLCDRRPEMLRVAIITSIRDLVSERVGGYHEEPCIEQGYIKGTLEYAIEQIVRGKLSHFIEIALVITDDTERDMQKLGNPLPLQPKREMPWIHPLSMRNRSGELITSLTRHIPSTYRLLPLHDKGGRETAKRKFEDSIRGAMLAHGAQILISDHFLCRLQHLIDPRYNDLHNKILNTHPGISDSLHRFRTPGVMPYADAIDRAQGMRGPVHNKMGASLHIIDENIDTGPVIFDIERTPVFTDDTWQQLCARNYLLSKNQAFVEGMRHYAQYIFPQLATINIEKLEPYEVDEPVYKPKI